MNQLPKDSIVTNKEAYKRGGVIGDNYKFANQKQRLCFKPDTYENIKTEFDRWKGQPPTNSNLKVVAARHTDT